jgi:tRNA dimethylallyltransferase
MNIGTGKPSTEQRKEVRHHLIDVVAPNEAFDAAMFRRLAMEALQDIHARGKTAIVCGGSGLYIRALVHGLFVGPSQDAALRERLGREIEVHGLHYLYGRLTRADPGAISRIHPNDRQRIIRALEVYELTGRPMSEWQNRHAFKGAVFESLKLGFDRDRHELYRLIDQRCERMVQDGLIEEVRALISQGYPLDLKAFRSVGYRHAGLYLTGAMSLPAAVALMQRDTRRLAKRQITWFRGDKEIHWFHPERDRNRYTSLVREFLSERHSAERDIDG